MAGKLTHGSFGQLPQYLVYVRDSEEINQLWEETQNTREQEYGLRNAGEKKKDFCGMSESKMKAEAEGRSDGKRSSTLEVGEGQHTG